MRQIFIKLCFSLAATLIRTEEWGLSQDMLKQDVQMVVVRARAPNANNYRKLKRLR